MYKLLLCQSPHRNVLLKHCHFRPAETMDKLTEADKKVINHIRESVYAGVILCAAVEHDEV